MTTVSVCTYTHSVTYVSDNILKSLKDIIRLTGLDPSEFAEDWETNQRAINTWLASGHLQTVKLEIYNPLTDALITRWDIDIHYGWSSGDGNFWADTDAIKYAIKKAGLVPNQARYRLLIQTKLGRPDVAGWGAATARSTEGMVRQSLGTAIEHNGLGARASYLRSA